MLGNEFGHFDPSGRVFAVTDPRAPTPWTNVVCNGRYGFVVSHNGGGFSWIDNSQLSVLTRWEMDLVRDPWGKFLYLRDLDSDAVWSLAPAPCRVNLDRYECDHTQGSSTFHASYEGIDSEWTMSVAPEDPVEVWSVTLTNRTQRQRRLRIASFFEWCCGVAPDAKREFHRLFFTTRHDAAHPAIIATKNMWDAPGGTERDHWNRPWPYLAAHAVGGIDFERPLAIADKAAFVGSYGDLARPEAMTRAEAADRAGFGRFADPCAALGGEFRIAPGQTVRLHYLLVAAEDEAKLGTLLDRYHTPAAVAETLRAADAAWTRRLAPTRVKTEQPDFDILNNHWLPYQAISGRLWGRTGYHQQSGAYGFRDQLQDSQVWLPLDPSRCREQILLHAAHQFADGSVYHWWHPLPPPAAEMGLRTSCSDDYLWLPFVVVNYLKETGEFGLLEEAAPFVDDRAGATVLEHCLRAFRRSFARHSPRGLPLIGSCDWNDGLSAVGIAGRGESVWLGFFLAGLLEDFAEVLDRAGREDAGADFRSRRRALVEAINEHAWDGSWFRRATLDDGRWIGSRENAEGRIYLNAQTWSILTGSTSEERAEAAWRSVREHLLADMGPLLLAPAYTEPDADIGYITRYAPGARENGGVYMHAATWALAAACVRKDDCAAERIWRGISPPLRAQQLGGQRYRAEPYVTPGNVDGPLSSLPGKAGWTWYTGSAAWLNRVCLERLVGVRAVWDGLMIDPCPFPGMGRVDVVRSWRGRPVRVRFDAREFSPDRAARLVVDGVRVDGIVVGTELLSRGRGETVSVDVSWGVDGRSGRSPAGVTAAGRNSA